jgi:hypothetical protein
MLFIHSVIFFVQYSPQATAISISVEEGFYQESTWELPSEKDISINGIDKLKVYLTAGMQDYDSFIICASGMFMLQIFFF